MAWTVDYGPCACCGNSVIVLGCCPDDAPIALPATLLVTLNTPGSGSTSCVPCGTYPGTDPFIPSGGDGTTLNIVYDAGLGYYVGTYTACDSTTVTVKGIPTGPDGLGLCHFELQALTEGETAEVDWLRVIPTESSGDLCAGDPLFLTGFWLRSIASGGSNDCDLYATVQE